MENDRNIDTNMYMIVSVYVYLCLHINLSLYLSIKKSIYLSVYLSILNGSFCHWRVAELRLSNVQLQLPARELLSNERLASFSFKVTIPHV